MILDKLKKLSFAGKASTYLISSVVNSSIPFLLMPVLTRVLTPADYGIIAMFTLTVSFIGAIVGFGTSGAIGVRYFQLTKEELADYISNCLLITLLSVVLLLFTIVVFEGPLVAFTGIPKDWLYLTVVFAFLQYIVNVRLSLWQVAGSAKKYGIFQISQTFLNASGSLLFVVVLGLGWQGRLIGHGLSLLIFSILGIVLIKKSFSSLQYYSKHYIYDALKFGLPLVPHGVGAMVIFGTDRYVINNLIGATEVGLYLIAIQVASTLGLITDAANKVYGPWLMSNLSKNIDSDQKVLIVRYSYLCMILFILLGCILGFLGPHLLTLVTGSDFHSAGRFLMPLSVSFAFGGCYYIVTNYLFYSNKTHLLAIITFVCGVVNVPLTWGLVLKFGPIGAAWSTLIIQLIFFLMTWIMAQRVYPMPWMSINVLSLKK